MSAEDTERSTQLRRLRLAGPLGRQSERARTSAFSVSLQSGSQQQFTSHAPAFKLHTQVQSNFVQGLHGKGGGGVGCEGGSGGRRAKGMVTYLLESTQLQPGGGDSRDVGEVATVLIVDQGGL